MKRVKIGQVVTMKENKHFYGKTLEKGQEVTRICTTEKKILDTNGKPEKGMWFTDLGSSFRLTGKEIDCGE